VKFLCRGLIPASTLFKSREYAEYQDQCGYNAEHDASASIQPWHEKGFRIVSYPPPEVAALSTATSRGSGYFTMLPLNKFLGIDLPRSQTPTNTTSPSTC